MWNFFRSLSGSSVLPYPWLNLLCFLGFSTIDAANAADFQRMYADAVNMDRRASAMVVSLDDYIARIDTHSFPLGEQVFLRERERDLLIRDVELNEMIGSLYASVTTTEQGEADQLLTRIALFHWTVLLRRQSMRSFHTEVDGLKEDPECAGDIIADQLLLRYFETLFEQKEAAQIKAVRTLAALARQTACLGSAQSALLASNLYSSFIELRSFLTLNGLEYVVPYVVQAASGPMLLFYDVEKYRGPQSPLARWFQENYHWLFAGAETERIPLHWHGLWLYDRRSGHMIGYHPTVTPQDENDINLELFFASIVKRENLGKYDCSFTEMIERGVSPHGYLCSGSICSAAPQPGATLTSPAVSYAELLSATGLSKETVQTTLCKISADGGVGGSTGGSRCGTGMSELGRSWAADTIRCISQQIIRPGQKLFRCFAEALGLCANPLDKFTKDLQQALFAGLRPGDRCTLEAAASGTSKSEPDAYRKMTQTIGAAEKEAEAKKDAASEQYREDISAANDQRQAQLDAADDYMDDPETYADLVEQADTFYKENVDKADKKRDAAYKEANDTLDQKSQEAREEYNAVVEEAQKQRCPPDTPECGTNSCTAMAAAVLQTMQCVEQASEGEPTPELTVVDPSPLDDPAAPSWLRCFGSFDDVSSAVSKQCWAYDCGPQELTGVTAEGRCSCGPATGSSEPGPNLTGMCHHVDCTDGTPTVRNGMCTCPAGLNVVTGGPVPKGPYVTSAPRLFSEVRINDILPPAGPRTSPARLPATRP